MADNEGSAPPPPKEAPFDAELFRRQSIARMTEATLMQLVASRPGQITAAMIDSNAAKTFEACTAIYDCCQRFCLSPEELEHLREQEEYEAGQRAHAELKAKAKALEDAKKQAKKDAAARARLAELEAAKGGGQ